MYILCYNNIANTTLRNVYRSPCVYVYMYVLRACLLFQCITLPALLFIDENDIFSKVVLKQKIRDIKDNISLYEPLDSKLYFNDLEVFNIITFWTFKSILQCMCNFNTHEL